MKFDLSDALPFPAFAGRGIEPDELCEAAHPLLPRRFAFLSSTANALLLFLVFRVATCQNFSVLVLGLPAGGTLLSEFLDRVALVDFEPTVQVPLRRTLVRSPIAGTCTAATLAVLISMVARPNGALDWAFVPFGFVPPNAVAHALGARALAFRSHALMRLALIGQPGQFTAVEAGLCSAHKKGASVVARLDSRLDIGVAKPRCFGDGGRGGVVILASQELSSRILPVVCLSFAEVPTRLCFLADPPSLDPSLEVSLRWSGLSVIEILPHSRCRLERVLNCSNDVAVAACALIAIAPVIGPMALAERLTFSRPVLFRQCHAGVSGQPTQVLGFRSMRQDLCDVSGAAKAETRDLRVTRVGGFLRRTSIEELPQFWNVLLGDTDWAPVNGSRGHFDILARAGRRIRLGPWYVDSWSLLLNLQVLVRTLLGGFASFRTY